MLNSKESILDSVKLAMGIIPEYNNFDPQLKMYINSAFSTLYQLGVGPDCGFMVENGTETWADYLKCNKLLSLVKSFVYMHVRLAFDPPTSSFALSSMKEQLDELTWRINVMVDPEVLGGRK